MEEKFVTPADVLATSGDAMGELVWGPLDYLMSDSEPCELVNNPTASLKASLAIKPIFYPYISNS